MNAARAAINTMIDLIERSPSSRDTLYATAIKMYPTQTPQQLFSHIKVGDNAYAKIQWGSKNFNTPSQSAGDPYGISDEQGRININGINTSNYQVLSALFELKGLSKKDADKLAQNIIYYDTTGSPAHGNKGRFYQNILELLEVPRMSQQIFDSIKDDVTVYGDIRRGLWINTDTANNDVIQAVARAASRINPTLNAANMIQKAYALRDGTDGASFAPDGGTTPVSSVANTAWPPALRDGKSNYYRIRAVGVDRVTATHTMIEAIIHYTPKGCQIIAWQRF